MAMHPEVEYAESTIQPGHSTMLSIRFEVVVHPLTGLAVFFDTDIYGNAAKLASMVDEKQAFIISEHLKALSFNVGQLLLYVKSCELMDDGQKAN